MPCGSSYSCSSLSAFRTLSQKETPQSEWENVQKAARKERRIVIWGPPGAEARQGLSAGFQKTFPGIEVEYSGAPGSKVAPRLVAERQAGQYLVDLHIGGTTTMLESLLPAKILEPIRPALLLPEVIDPKKWLNGALDFSDRQEKYNLVFSANVKTPAAINPHLMKKDMLRSYWDLLNPKLSGKIVMRDPLSVGPGLATATFWYAESALGKEFMQKLFTQQKVIFSSDDRQMLEWVARGEYLVAAAPSELHANGLKSKGLPIELVRAEQFKEQLLDGGLRQRGPDPARAAPQRGQSLSQLVIIQRRAAEMEQGFRIFEPARRRTSGSSRSGADPAGGSPLSAEL
jgi:ABC-type Fe3+ transport system substrate-binding protein